MSLSCLLQFRFRTVRAHANLGNSDNTTASASRTLRGRMSTAASRASRKGERQAAAQACRPEGPSRPSRAMPGHRPQARPGPLPLDLPRMPAPSQAPRRAGHCHERRASSARFANRRTASARLFFAVTVQQRFGFSPVHDRVEQGVRVLVRVPLDDAVNFVVSILCILELFCMVSRASRKKGVAKDGPLSRGREWPGRR